MVSNKYLNKNKMRRCVTERWLKLGLNQNIIYARYRKIAKIRFVPEYLFVTRFRRVLRTCLVLKMASGIFWGTTITDGMGCSIRASRVEFQGNCFTKSSAVALEVNKVSSSEINGRKDDLSKLRLMLLSSDKNELLLYFYKPFFLMHFKLLTWFEKRIDFLSDFLELGFYALRFAMNFLKGDLKFFFLLSCYYSRKLLQIISYANTDLTFFVDFCVSYL